MNDQEVGHNPRNEITRRTFLTIASGVLGFGAITSLACQSGSGRYPVNGVSMEAAVTPTPEISGREVDLGTHIILEGQNLTSIANKYMEAAIKAGCTDFSYKHIVKANENHYVGQDAGRHRVIQGENRIKAGEPLYIRCYISN